MNSKLRKPLILFIASFLLIGAGIFLKHVNVNLSGTIFGAGMMVQFFAILWLIFVLLKPNKK